MVNGSIKSRKVAARLLAATMFFLFPALAVQAQSSAIANIEAPSDPTAFPLYAGDKVGSKADEVWTRMGPVTAVRNVTRPTLTPVLPTAGTGNGTAVIIAPGGGQIMLVMQNEGDRVARQLADQGFTVFVLKYRLVPTPREIKDLIPFFANLRDQSAKGEVRLDNPGGNVDAQAAVARVRTEVARWGIDPQRVGLLGFSSGAQVSRVAALSPAAESRPDFVGLIYGAMDAVEVPATAPPMFAAIAMDDKTVSPAGFPAVAAWMKAGRPVELHAYQSGGHGFASGGPSSTSRLYLDQFVAWLAMQGLTKKDLK